MNDLFACGSTFDDDVVELPPASSGLLDTQALVAPAAQELPQSDLVEPSVGGMFGFPAGLPLELAAGLVSMDTILATYRISAGTLDALMQNQLFKSQYDEAVEQCKKPDGRFRLQARIMSSNAIETQYALMVNPEVVPTVRLRASELIVEASGFSAPKKEVSTPVAQPINIIFNQQPAGFSANIVRGSAQIVQDDE